MQVVRTLGWLVSIVYSTIPVLWLIVHPRARKFGKSRAPLTIVGPIWCALWLVAAAATWRWRHILAYDTRFSWLAAAPLFAAGLYVYRESFREFTFDQILGRSELHPHRHEQRLVTSGIRQRVRHPIYLAHLLELLGWSIGTGLLVVYALTAFAVLTGSVMLQSEDRELEERFGEEYRAYRRRVSSIVPWR